MSNYMPVFTHGVIDMSNFRYPRWENITDDDIKLKVAKRYISENTEVSNWKIHRLPDGRVVTSSSSNQDFIDYFNIRMAPLLPDSDEIIKRKDWAQFETLLGETLGILNHPVFEKMAGYIRENNNQQAEALVVSSCGRRKPYSRSQLIQGLMAAPRHFPGIKGLYDVAILSNSGVIPVSEGNDFSFCYPFRYYDWNHSVEEERGIITEVENKMYFYLKQFLMANDYKNVAIIAKMVYPSYYNIYKRLSSELTDINFFFAMDEDHINRFVNLIDYRGDAVKIAGRRRRYQQSSHIVADIMDYFNLPVPDSYRAYLDQLVANRKRRGNV